jgi:hypothetical protein
MSCWACLVGAPSAERGLGGPRHGCLPLAESIGCGAGGEPEEDAAERECSLGR